MWATLPLPSHVLLNSPLRLSIGINAGGPIATLEDRVFISNLMLLSAALVLFGSVWTYRRTHQWLARVVRTKAEIVAWVEDEDDSGVSYRAVYKYAGVETDVVGGNDSIRNPPTIGEEAVIYYDPSYPSNAFLEGSRAPFVLPGCGVVIGVILIVWAIYVRFDPSI